MRKSKADAAEAKAKEENEWAKIEAAAQKAFEKDVGTHAPIHQQHIAPTTSAPSSAYAAQPVGIMSGGAVRPSHPLNKSSHSAHAPPPPAPPAAKISNWQATIDPTTGATYYYNIQTLATSWTNPDAAVETTPTIKSDTKVTKDEKSAVASSKKHPRDESNNSDRSNDATKKVKLDTASAPATSVPQPAVEIDEDTGLGKWTTVEPTADSKDEEESTQPTHRMTPFGMIEIKPSATPSSASASGSSSSSSSTSAPSKSSFQTRYADLAGDDDADADEDVGGPIDVAQQLRNQFGPSPLIHAKGAAYEAGADLLANEDESKNAPVVVTFKKKSKGREANQRKPVAASNN